MLNLKIWTIASGCWAAISFTLCVIGGIVAPGFPIPHRTLELVLPGFIWISPAAFILGFVESAGFGVYSGLLFAALHNLLARTWPVAQRRSSNTKAA
jgi:hypothetical protein